MAAGSAGLVASSNDRRRRPRSAQRGIFEERDVNAYMNVWHDILARFPTAAAWESRVRAIGHGLRKELSSGEALEIASQATPETPQAEDLGDPNGRKVG